jgi:hypothetical protein
MQFSPLSCHFIPLRTKYSPQHPALASTTLILMSSSCLQLRLSNCLLSRVITSSPLSLFWKNEYRFVRTSSLSVYPSNVARQRLRKHVPAARNARATMEGLLDAGAVFSVRSMSYQILNTHWKESRMNPAGLGTKNDCAGDGQRQFTRPTDCAGETQQQFIRPNNRLVLPRISCLCPQFLCMPYTSQAIRCKYIRNIWLSVRVMEVLIDSLYPPSCFCFMGLHFLLASVFSDTLNLCCFLRIWGWISHP